MAADPAATGVAEDADAPAPARDGTDAAVHRTQVPGVYRRSVGSITVTAVADGYATLPLGVVPDATPEAADELARASFTPTGDLQCVVNTYLIETPARTVMVDTGFGGAGVGTGRIWQNLRAAGVDPKNVDVLVLSHGHPDHTSGMLAPDGSAAFPNAELLVHANEVAYWTDPGNQAKAPEFLRDWFDGFRTVFAPYRDRTTLIRRDGEEIVPGVRVKELFGHTPGHIGLHVADGGAEHLIWTDTIHFSHLQFRRPEWGVVFDVDPELARRTRMATLDMTAADGISVSGMHLVFPAFGHVRRDGAAYAFEPARWQYDLGGA